MKKAMPTSTALPNRIRELRDAKGFTLTELADRVGTSNQQISYLELGSRQLTTRWMERIAPHLGVRPADLLPVNPTRAQDVDQREEDRVRAEMAAIPEHLVDMAIEELLLLRIQRRRAKESAS